MELLAIICYLVLYIAPPLFAGFALCLRNSVGDEHFPSTVILWRNMYATLSAPFDIRTAPFVDIEYGSIMSIRYPLVTQ